MNYAKLQHTRRPLDGGSFAAGQLAVKRASDIFVAIVLLVILTPVLLAIAIAVMTTSPGGVIYSQDRVGRNGRTFKFYKFRSMVRDNDRLLTDFLDTSPELRTHWVEFQKLPSDPRVTPVGAVIRRTSLDELPQLWNVLRGDMSLVGPRPCLPAQVHLYSALFRDYCSVRPGITGLWQVSGRNRLSYAERVRLDSDYVQGWSLWLDLQILCKTVAVVCSGH